MVESHDNKVMSASTPVMVPTGSKHAVTRTYPKSGAQQTIPNVDIEPDTPRGSAVTATYAKSGQKQSI